ncbi:Ribose/xylose/arabinose/galactoside ABC-type transport system, permease component [Natranaeroarchaeum sulfidigenes]|uniref:Ribose/xylose/arabinose/galactoside ABC-type transport system, permease component n=2 Tax=Natranaeroarchaeum sulfidigenes TaxID=2784880 RepID=A0A897MWV1_9EURY|nr:Ribose/xylose/arabinose/galactoside ABC-type transport system, permease component [Natranaeroarchaeum sulfidigenes]
MDQHKAMLAVLDHMIWPILLVVCLGVFLLVPQTFGSLGMIELVIYGSAALGFLVLAEGICLLSGHFDLSIGAIAGFSAMFTAMLLSPDQWGVIQSPVLAVVIILTVATLIGVVNGVMISKVGVDPFLQTLSFLIIFEGAQVWLSSVPVSNLPDGFTATGGSSGVSITLMIAAFAVMGLLLKYTSFGQAVYAVGSNKDSARAVGIKTDQLIITVYALSGFLSGIAGLILLGRVGSVSPQLANDLLFPAFAAAVIGGISLFGGRGKIAGALGGVLLLGVIQSALNISGMSVNQIQTINGIVLLIAILLYNTRTNIRDRILTNEVSG